MLNSKLKISKLKGDFYSLIEGLKNNGKRLL